MSREARSVRTRNNRHGLGAADPSDTARGVAGLASHLETTSGASQVSASTGGLLQSLLSTLDGTGVGVAVLDSGVDGEHNDLKDELRSKRRVVLSLDFTGR